VAVTRAMRLLYITAQIITESELYAT